MSKLACPTCPERLQAYFDGRVLLPCFNCHPGDIVMRDFDPHWYGVETVWRWRLPFTRNHATDMWQPTACIDPTTIPAMVDVFKAEGLEGCFAKPVHPETFRERQAAYRVERINELVAAGILRSDFDLPRLELPPIATPHEETYCCHARGCELHGIPAPVLAKPPHLHGNFVLKEGETLSERCPDGGCTWERFKMDGFFAVDRRRVTEDATGKVATIPQFSPTPAGCRLGCACTQHKPPREPWVPSVDEVDLLPDA